MVTAGRRPRESGFSIIRLWRALAAVARDPWLWGALGLSGLYWVVESLLSVVIEGGAFTTRLINLDAHEVVMRFTVLGVLLSLGLFTRRTFRQRARVEETLRREGRERELLAEAGRIASSTVELRELYGALCTLIGTLIPFERMSVRLIDPETGACETTHVESADPRPRGCEKRPGQTCVVANARPGSPGTLAMETRLPGVPCARLQGWRSVIAAPLFAGGRAIGVLQLGTNAADAYGPQDLGLLTRIGAQIAGAIDIARMHKAALRDRDLLRRSEERFRRIFENSNDAIFVVDLDHDRILDANPEACRMLEYPREELLKLPMSAIHPNEIDNLVQFGATVRSEGRGRTDQLSCATASGRVVPVEMSASMMSIGGKPCAVTVVRDMTEHNRIETELRMRGAALEAAADMIVIADERGVIKYVNDAFCRETGYSRDELVGATPRLLKSGRHGPAFYRDMWDTILAGRAWSGTLVNRRKDGSEYPHEMTITPVVGAGGENGGFIGIQRNISDRLRIEQEREARAKLDAENRELQRVSEARSQFLSTVSHELKTPLTSIIAFTDILARNAGSNLTDRQLKQLGVMARSGRRLATLIDDLMDVSRIDSGRFELQYSDFDARETLTEVVRSFDPILTERGQSLAAVLPDEGLWLRADQNRITQVVTNLLSNASKYSPDGACIELSVRRAGESLAVSVSDRGIGISEEDQAKLFTPFFRAADDETRARPGTGLGLVIVKSIVELHGGEIELQSEPGVGTTVGFSVPGVLEDGAHIGRDAARGSRRSRRESESRPLP